MPENLRVDALMPLEIAQKAQTVGVKKAQMEIASMFVLAVLAGAFIALGAIFATVVGTSPGVPFGLLKLMMGLVFSLGLILVVIAGAELFTGNNLIVMSWISGKVTTGGLLRNWGIVYVGNFVGAVMTAYIMYLTHQYEFADGAVGVTALKIANGKIGLDFAQAVALGAMCNALVCLAVWLTYSAHTVADKVLAIIFPITAFVAAGFEHSVANMYFIPIGLFIKALSPEFVAASGLDLTALTWQSFFVNNLLPVTIGNIIGGAGMVALVYWFIYLRSEAATE
jgi:formate transporter